MATVGPLYFNNVVESTGGAGSHVWSGLDNLKAAAGEATTFFNSGLPSYFVRLNGMTFSPLPSGVQITQLQIQIPGYYSGGGPGVGVNFGNVNIQGGANSFSSNNLTTSQLTKTWAGSPAYWGLTDQQALEFVQGTRYLAFQMLENGSSVNFTVHVPWVQCTFTYRPLGVTMPCIF